MSADANDKRGLLNLPEQDHYEIARDRALRRARERLDPSRPAKLGVNIEPSGDLNVPMLCWKVQVGLDPYGMRVAAGGEEVDIVWQILVLDYLAAEDPVPPKEFVSLADFAGARSYQRVFEGRVNGRLTRTAGREREAFLQAVEKLGGVTAGEEPLRCVVKFFPLLEFEVVRHEADEDFPASCRVLLPDNMLRIFSLEDGIVAAEKLVSALDGRTPSARRPEEAP